MKLKAPKTWQMVMIFVSIVLLAVGGGILYVYLTGGFDEDVTYPESIDVLDSDSVYNSTTMQYEAVEDFELTFTTSTESVNRGGITLSFPSGVAVTRDPEYGTISDGVIVVPENLVLDQAFTVSLVQQAYDSTTFELVENVDEHEGDVTYINKGGISQLVITSQNNTDFNRQITIAVDVPVLGLDIKFVDETTGYEYDAAGGFVIPEGTNFTAVPVFKPEASAYQYSDNLNSAIANKREKSVFYDLGKSVDGITLNYTDSGVYFTAHEEVSSGNLVYAFAFANAREENAFAQANSSLQGQAFYNQAISTLSTSDSAVTGNASVSVIEANVGLFSVAQNTEANPYELSVDKLFTIKAGNDASEGAALSAVIQDIHGADLSGMIRGIGARIISATSSSGGDMLNSVELRGGETRTTADGQNYTMINSSVRDLAESYFELSSSAEGSIQIGVVLLVQDEEGRYNVFGEEKVFYATVTTHVEDSVSWKQSWADIGGITMKIIYADGNPVATEYPHDLSDFADVPEGNVYQTKMFFVYGTDANQIISVESLGAGTYQIGGSGTELYPLSGSQLVALKAGEVNLIFATVRTDAYGTPVMTEGGLYQLVQDSSHVKVTVENSLRGIKSVTADVTNPDTANAWRSDIGEATLPAYAIPTGSSITGDTVGTIIQMEISLEEGDAELFIEEYNNGNITFFASTSQDGLTPVTNIFRFSAPELVESYTDRVTVKIGVEPNNTFENPRGTGYYLFVAYNNSISNEPKLANIGGETIQDYITVYNQTTQRLDSALDGGIYNATQTLETNGESATSITGGTESNPNQYTGASIDIFNNALERYNSGTGIGIRTFDAYGRVFDGAYTVESNNYEAVRVTGTALSFGNVQNGTARITITSGAASASFTMNVTSQGVSAIYVLGTRYENTTAVSYTYTPSAEGIAADSAEIKLKNETEPDTGAFPADTALQTLGNGILLVTVKETEGVDPTGVNIFSPSAYDITFDSTFLSTVSSDFWDMISYKTTDGATWSTGVAPTAGTSIYSVRVNQHFGEDVTIRFNARNDAGTLNFNFDLTIKATATLNSNTLSQVDYGSSIGVEGHTASDTIGVYAGFGINLNDSTEDSPTNYLSVENVNWGAVFGARGGVAAATYYIRPDNSGVLRIYTSETDGNPSIATIQNGVLTFADVSVATTYNLTLYAVTDIQGGQVVGNSYGYWTDLSFTVYPNLQISYAPSGDTISLADIANSSTETGYLYSNIFTIQRITTLERGEDSAVGTLPLPTYGAGTTTSPDTLTAGGIITHYAFVDPDNGLEYIAVDTTSTGSTRGTITRTGATLTFTRGEPEKQITLLAYNSAGDQILSKSFTLTLGINVNALAGGVGESSLIYTTSGETSTNAISEITFNEMTSALITSGTVYVNRKWSTSYDETGAPTGMTAMLNQINMGQGRFCTLTSTEDDHYTLSFNPRQAIYAEEDAYLSFTFKFKSSDDSDDSDGTEYATWQIPIVYSQIGSDFVGDEDGTDYDLYKIIHNGLTVDLPAGQEYDLFNEAGLTAGHFGAETGLSVSFSYLVDGEVADYSNSVISSLSGGQLTLKNLSQNYAGLTDGVLPIEIRITILNAANGESQPFVLHVNVQPNATLDKVHYPYSGSAEFVTVASGGNVPIDLDDTSINRFPNTTTPSLGESPEVPLGTGTYSIVQLLIDGEPAENLQSYVTLSGSTLTLRNPGGTLKNATLTIRKSYANFFGEALDYVFSINSVAVDYALNVEKGSTNAYADEVKNENGRVTINLARTTSGASHTFSVTTTQTDSANNTSNAPTSVTTVLSQAKPGETTETSTDDNITITIDDAEYKFELTSAATNPKTLTITTPTFVATDTLITLTFVINSGEQTIDVDVFIPATANLEWIADNTLYGGSEYNVAGGLIKNLNDGLLGETSSISTSGITVTGVSAKYEDSTINPDAKKGYISTSDSAITIEPIYGATETATIRINYTYVQNITFGSGDSAETYAVLFKPGSTSDGTPTNATLTLQQVGVASDAKTWTGTGSSSTGGTITIGDGENAVTYTYSYNSETGKLTLTASPSGDSTIVRNVHTGYTEKTFNFEPNLRSNNRAIEQIVAGTIRQKAIDNGTDRQGFGILVPERGTVLTRSGTYSLTRTNVDSSLFDEESGLVIDNSGGSVCLKIAPDYVSQNTPTVIRFTLTYTKGDYTFTTDVIEMTFTIVAAATLSVNYPQPFGSAPSAYANGQDLGYEVRPINLLNGDGASGIDLAEFFATDGTETGKADLASENRFVYKNTDATSGDTPETSTDGTAEYSVRSFSGITANTSGETYKITTCTDCTSCPEDCGDDCTCQIFKLAEGARASEGASVTFGITYKGVTAEYVVYFFTSPITAQTRSTIHQVVTSDGAYEEIYADQTGIYVGSSASATLSENPGDSGNYTGMITVNGKSYSVTYTSSSPKLTLTGTEPTTSYTSEGSTITVDGAKYYYTVSDTGTLTLTPTTNIFEKNRLVELGIDASAPAGQLQQIWIREIGETNPVGNQPLTSFLLTGSLISAGNNIFVDIGLIGMDYAPTDNLLESEYEFVIGSFNSNGNFIETSYLTFIRQASRVEYFYTLSNGGTQLITHADLKIVEEEVVDGTSGWEEATGTTTQFENGQIATFRVQYQISSGDAAGAVYLQAKKELDITVDNAWTSSNHTVLEMQTNHLNHYTLVDMAGIRHPSTGELLSADNIGDATINVEVVNPQSDATEFARIIGTGEGIPPISQFVYQTTDGSHDYLTFTQITVSQTDTRVYDFYLFGEGADNDGSYVLLRFTYSAEGGAEEEYYLVVRLIPDYDVRIGGVQVAEAGVTTDGAASNETLPYDFVSREISEDTNAPMNIATTGDSIVSFVRRNWDSSNIAHSLTYELTVQEEGNGYNAASNIQKLNLTVSENDWSLEPASASTTHPAADDVYTWSNPTSTEGLVLRPDPIAFGTKTYMLTITNAWGFKIEFFFTLSPPTAQNPVISTANTDATYREGETFDVGVIYDLVTVTQTEHEPEEEDGKTTYTYDITVARDQLPDDNSGQTKMIVVDNIATWGVSSSTYQLNNPSSGSSPIPTEAGKFATGGSYYTEYLANIEDMLYQYVTIESVSFKFGDEVAVEADYKEHNLVEAGESTTAVTTGNRLLTSADVRQYNSSWNVLYCGMDGSATLDVAPRFTVPNLPGWYYGTSNSIQVEVHVTLKYTKGSDTETCDISFPATISRQYSITSENHVVTDAEEFTLSQYISVRDTNKTGNDANVTSDSITYYDDTLEITLPQNGGAATIRVDVTRVTRDGTTTFTGTRTVTNTYQERQQTVYESMSDIVGTTLQPNTDTVVITVTPNDISSSHEDFRVRYADDDITESVTAKDLTPYEFGTGSSQLSSTDIFALNFGTGSTSAYATVVMQLTRGSDEEAQLFANSRTFEVAASESTRYAYVGTVDEIFNGVQGFDEFKAGDKVKVYFTGSNLASLYFGTSSASTDEGKAEAIATPSGGATKVEAYKSYAFYSSGSPESDVPKWKSMTNNKDTLYIENSARFSGGYGVIDKTYIVGIDTDTTPGADYFYRHDQTFYLARAYYSLDTGLGETTIKQIDVSDYFVGSGSTQIQVATTPGGAFGNITSGNADTGDVGNYKIPIGIWGEDVTLYTAKDSENGNVVANTSGEEDFANIFSGAYSITYSYRAGATPSYSFKASGGGAPSDGTVDSTTGQGSFNMTVDDVPRTYKFTVDSKGTLTSVNGHAVKVQSGGTFSSILLTSSVYFEVSDASGSYSQAYFDGTYLYTGDGYTIDRQNYILINIYVKASGGPDKTFERNSRDHLLGSYRIILV